MNKDFWKAAAIRAIRTVAQAALAMIPAAATIQQVNWLTVLSTAALAGVVSILTSIATGLPEVDEGEPVKAESDEEAECKVTVKAYDDYDDDGNPIVDEDCDACDLSPYVDDDGESGDGE